MGWTEAEFYLASPRYFFNAWRAFQKKQEAELKREENWQRWQLEVQRQGFLALLNIQLDKPDRMNATNFFPLPWDEKPEPKQAADNAKEAADFIKEMGYDKGIPADEFYK